MCGGCAEYGCGPEPCGGTPNGCGVAPPGGGYAGGGGCDGVCARGTPALPAATPELAFDTGGGCDGELERGGCAAAVAAPAWNIVFACGDAAGPAGAPAGGAHGDDPLDDAAWYGCDGVTCGAAWLAPAGNTERQRSHVHALCG
jgi:hypothetical protein